MAEKSYNHAVLLGRLGDDPRVGETQRGIAFANFSVATGESWVDSNGEEQERTQWHRCVAFNGLAGVVQRYLHKGDRVMVTGRISYRSYDDGSDKPRWSTDIVCQDMVMLGSPRRNGNGNGMPSTSDLADAAVAASELQAPEEAPKAAAVPETPEEAPKAAKSRRSRRVQKAPKAPEPETTEIEDDFPEAI